jgi:hypothetical protein
VRLLLARCLLSRALLLTVLVATTSVNEVPANRVVVRAPGPRRRGPELASPARPGPRWAKRVRKGRENVVRLGGADSVIQNQRASGSMTAPTASIQTPEHRWYVQAALRGVAGLHVDKLTDRRLAWGATGEVVGAGVRELMRRLQTCGRPPRSSQHPFDASREGGVRSPCCGSRRDHLGGVLGRCADVLLAAPPRSFSAGSSSLTSGLRSRPQCARAASPWPARRP